MEDSEQEQQQAANRYRAGQRRNGAGLILLVGVKEGEIKCNHRKQALEASIAPNILLLKHKQRKCVANLACFRLPSMQTSTSMQNPPVRPSSRVSYWVFLRKTSKKASKTTVEFTPRTAVASAQGQWTQERSKFHRLGGNRAEQI